ncbi:hypothetical protein DYQ86_06925 [Acidobacteria bacterium AB60]|nr:hypothetical protein DYQ86_06925 [Acidobacteria bacterium AB60]
MPQAMLMIFPTLPVDGGGMLVRNLTLPPGPPDPSHFRMDPVMVRVKSAQETNRFDNSYPGLSDVDSQGNVAVSKTHVVLLVRAITQDERRNAPETPPHSFLVFYDLNGSLKKIVPVEVGPSVSALGLFGNGEILIADGTSAGAGSVRKHLRLYNDKGEFQKELYVDDPNIDLTKGERFSRPAGDLVGIFPSGDNLLAVFKSDRGVRLQELNSSGVVREWNLVLPQDTAPMQLIPSDGPYWLVSYEKTGQDTGQPTGHHAEGIIEFDKATSEPVANLTSSSPQILVGAVYEHSGEIVGLVNDPQDNSPQIFSARIGGK